MITVREVPLNFVNRAWSAVEPFLAASVQYSNGELTLDETKVYVTQGIWQLYIASNEEGVVSGAATVHYLNRTNDRVAYVTNIGGRLIAKPEIFSQFCELLRTNGATCIEGTVRDSLMRLWARLGASKKSITVYIPLD